MKKITKVFGAKEIPVIQITGMLGTGEKDDPVRTGYQYWTLDGELIATLDSKGDLQL